MADLLHFQAFLLAALIVIISPGSDTVFILARSLGQGRKAGIVSVLGISTGTFIHTLLAAFGLSIIIAQSELAYNIIKYAGAAYLVYLGIRILLDKTPLNTELNIASDTVDYQKIYRQAIINNLLNPKVALFFISFLPQFIHPASQNTAKPLLTLGLIFLFLGLIWCLILATFAAFVIDRLRKGRDMTALFNKICGITLIGLGLNAALVRKGM